MILFQDFTEQKRLFFHIKINGMSVKPHPERIAIPIFIFLF